MGQLFAKKHKARKPRKVNIPPHGDFIGIVQEDPG
jgi:hypothetical protein